MPGHGTLWRATAILFTQLSQHAYSAILRPRQVADIIVSGNLLPYSTEITADGVPVSILPSGQGIVVESDSTISFETNSAHVTQAAYTYADNSIINVIEVSPSVIVQGGYLSPGETNTISVFSGSIPGFRATQYVTTIQETDIAGSSVSSPGGISSDGSTLTSTNSDVDSMVTSGGTFSTGIVHTGATLTSAMQSSPPSTTLPTAGPGSSAITSSNIAPGPSTNAGESTASSNFVSIPSTYSGQGTASSDVVSIASINTGEKTTTTDGSVLTFNGPTTATADGSAITLGITSSGVASTGIESSGPATAGEGTTSVASSVISFSGQTTVIAGGSTITLRQTSSGTTGVALSRPATTGETTTSIDGSGFTFSGQTTVTASGSTVTLGQGSSVTTEPTGSPSGTIIVSDLTSSVNFGTPEITLATSVINGKTETVPILFGGSYGASITLPPASTTLASQQVTSSASAIRSQATMFLNDIEAWLNDQSDPTKKSKVSNDIGPLIDNAEGIISSLGGDSSSSGCATKKKLKSRSFISGLFSDLTNDFSCIVEDLGGIKAQLDIPTPNIDIPEIEAFVDDLGSELKDLEDAEDDTSTQSTDQSTSAKSTASSTKSGSSTTSSASSSSSETETVTAVCSPLVTTVGSSISTITESCSTPQILTRGPLTTTTVFETNTAASLMDLLVFPATPTAAGGIAATLSSIVSEPTQIYGSTSEKLGTLFFWVQNITSPQADAIKQIQEAKVDPISWSEKKTNGGSIVENRSVKKLKKGFSGIVENKSIRADNETLGETFEKRAPTIQQNAPWNLAAISGGGGSYDPGPYYYDANGANDILVFIIDSGINSDALIDIGELKSYQIVQEVLAAPYPAGTTLEDEDDHGTGIAALIAGKSYGAGKFAKIFSIKEVEFEDSDEEMDLDEEQQTVAFAGLLNAFSIIDEFMMSPSGSAYKGRAIINLSSDLVNIPSIAQGDIQDYLNVLFTQYGMILIAPGDNEGTYPGVFAEQGLFLNNLMTVGASDNQNNARTYSPSNKIRDNRNNVSIDVTKTDNLKMFAPGEHIATYDNDGDLDYQYGSSYSVPQVVGTAAMLINSNPSRYSMAGINNGLLFNDMYAWAAGRPNKGNKPVLYNNLNPACPLGLTKRGMESLGCSLRSEPSSTASVSNIFSGFSTISSTSTGLSVAASSSPSSPSTNTVSSAATSSAASSLSAATGTGIGSTLPAGSTATPTSGISCNSAGGSGDSQEHPPYNTESATQAVATYCANLIQNKVILNAQNTNIKPGVVPGAENGADIALDVLYDGDYCVNNITAAEVNFPQIGQSMCEQLFDEVVSACVQTSGSQNTQYTGLGGAAGVACAIWSVEGQPA